MCECTMNKWSTKLYLYHCLSHFPSHGHQLGLQKQMFRENLRHKMFINPCEGKGKEAELSREEPNCKEGPAKPQSGSRESGAHMGHPGNHQGLRQLGLCSPTLLGYQSGAAPRRAASKEAALQPRQTLKEHSPSGGHLDFPWRRSGWRNSTCTKLKVKPRSLASKSYTIRDPIASLTSPPASCSPTGLLAKQAPT